jgi:hypothetical protein
MARSQEGAGKRREAERMGTEWGEDAISSRLRALEEGA